MKHVTRLLAILLLMTPIASWAEPPTASAYGAPMPAEALPVPLGRAIDRLGDSAEWRGTITGKVTEVCRKKGCWMVLVDGEHFARVTFEDYGFFVPTTTEPQPATVSGRLSREVLTAETLNHYEADAGRTGTATGPAEHYVIVATSVLLSGTTGDP